MKANAHLFDQVTERERNHQLLVLEEAAAAN